MGWVYVFVVWFGLIAFFAFVWSVVRAWERHHYGD